MTERLKESYFICECVSFTHTNVCVRMLVHALLPLFCLFKVFSVIYDCGFVSHMKVFSMYSVSITNPIGISE